MKYQKVDFSYSVNHFGQMFDLTADSWNMYWENASCSSRMCLGYLVFFPASFFIYSTSSQRSGCFSTRLFISWITRFFEKSHRKYCWSISSKLSPIVLNGHRLFLCSKITSHSIMISCSLIFIRESIPIICGVFQSDQSTIAVFTPNCSVVEITFPQIGLNLEKT